MIAGRFVRGEDPRVVRSRAAVMEAATELLLVEGLNAVTVDAVLARSGVARSTLYRHWAGRTELLVDVFRDLVPEVGAVPAPGPFRDRLVTAALDAARELRASGAAPTIVNLLHAAHFDRDLSRFCERFTSDKRAPVLRVVADARAAGQLRDDVSDDDAVSLLMGPLFMRVVMTGEPVDDPWVRAHAERVHRAVAAC